MCSKKFWVLKIFEPRNVIAKCSEILRKIFYFQNYFDHAMQNLNLKKKLFKNDQFTQKNNST